MSIILLAGINDSGPTHWQRLWLPRFQRPLWVDHKDWDEPDADEWVSDLEAALAQATGPRVVVAHSLGCLLMCEWLKRHPGAKLDGAFCVAPPDPASPAFPHHLVSGFGPGHQVHIAFPAVVVASRDDPYAGFAYAGDCARAWSAPIIDAGHQGHLNAGSGLGDWDEGWGELQAFLKHEGLEGA